jgi:hypothetical protein
MGKRVRSWVEAAAIVVGVGALGVSLVPPAYGQGSPGVEVHGFVSQGALLSTGNNYLTHSKRGSVEFFEAAVNVSTEVADRLRVGLQLFTRDLGPIGNYNANVDWAYLDYRFREWLGFRAGRIKLPFGLYNEFSDVDAARLPVLLPQSVYAIRSRDFLLAQTGFSLYGSAPAGPLGGFDYQLAFGTIFLDAAGNPTITRLDVPYVAAAQLFWRTPISGLRLGGSGLAVGLNLDGMLPTGPVHIEYERVRLLVGSLEYVGHGWLVAAEYAFQRGELELTPPVPGLPTKLNDERFYGMVAYRFTDWFEAGTYYSVHFIDAADRRGSDGTRFPVSHRAYQRDLAVSLRFDVNEHWLFKLEGHHMVGTAGLDATDVRETGELAESWGLFLVKTTLTF